MNAEKGFNCVITTPKGVVFDEPIKRATLATTEGEITILTNHEPIIALARDGEIEIETERGVIHFDAQKGVVEMREGGSLLLLLEGAEKREGSGS